MMDATAPGDPHFTVSGTVRPGIFAALHLRAEYRGL
jgi:hypothetical protein